MIPLEIVWSRQAVEDIVRIQEFVARTSPRYALLLASRIVEAVERLRDFPESGRVVPELDEPRVREVIYRAYRIIYQTHGDDRIEILTVFRGTRQFPSTNP